MTLLQKVQTKKPNGEHTPVRNGNVVFNKKTELINFRCNIPYLDDQNPAHTMDIYSPQATSLRTPTVIYISGGSMNSARKDITLDFCADLCRAGFHVFLPEYRMGPNISLYDQLDDIYHAIKRVDQLLVDMNTTLGNVFLIGEEFGAFLAMHTTAIQRNPTLAQVSGLSPSYLEVSAMVTLCGIFDIEKSIYGTGTALQIILGKDYKNTQYYPYLTPRNIAVSLYLPDSLIITNRFDCHRHQSRVLSSILTKNKIPNILKIEDDCWRSEHARSKHKTVEISRENVISEISAYLKEYTDE